MSDNSFDRPFFRMAKLFSFRGLEMLNQTRLPLPASLRDWAQTTLSNRTHALSGSRDPVLSVMSNVVIIRNSNSLDERLAASDKILERTPWMIEYSNRAIRGRTATGDHKFNRTSALIGLSTVQDFAIEEVFGPNGTLKYEKAEELLKKTDELAYEIATLGLPRPGNGGPGIVPRQE